jgi:hypothetical protein
MIFMTQRGSIDSITAKKLKAEHASGDSAAPGPGFFASASTVQDRPVAMPTKSGCGCEQGAAIYICRPHRHGGVEV